MPERQSARDFIAVQHDFPFVDFRRLIHDFKHALRACHRVEDRGILVCDFIERPCELLGELDYAIASMHAQNYNSGTIAENTSAYLNAMTHPCVKVLGHCDNPAFPVDYETLAVGAKENGVIFEINEASLAPYGYRGDTRANNREILKYCMKYEIPIVLSSDSHGVEHIGDFTCAAEFVHEMMFPEKMILNNDIPRLKMILSER